MFPHELSSIDGLAGMISSVMVEIVCSGWFELENTSLTFNTASPSISSSSSFEVGRIPNVLAVVSSSPGPSGGGISIQILRMSLGHTYLFRHAFSTSFWTRKQDSSFSIICHSVLTSNSVIVHEMKFTHMSEDLNLKFYLAFGRKLSKSIAPAAQLRSGFIQIVYRNNRIAVCRNLEI